MGESRAQVQLTGVVLGFLTLVALIALAPFFYEFSGMASSAADPFSALLLRLSFPLLLVALILSVGVSARG
jgi:hypothetical protein